MAGEDGSHASRRGKMPRVVIVVMGTPLVLALLALLSLHAVSLGILSGGMGSSYSVSQVIAGLQQHPRQWGGRIVSVRGVALQPIPQGFILVDQDPPPGNRPEQVLWVASSPGNWRIKAMQLEGMIFRYIPGLASIHSSAVYRLRLPLTLCAQYDQCPSYLVQ